MIRLKDATALATEVENHARDAGHAVAIAILDAGGNLVLKHRMDGAALVSVDMSECKAYTATALQMPTSEVGDLNREGHALHNITSVSGGRYVGFGGGIPIWREAEFFGAIGVSGASSEEDVELARAAIAALGLTEAG